MWTVQEKNDVYCVVTFDIENEFSVHGIHIDVSFSRSFSLALRCNGSCETSALKVYAYIYLPLCQCIVYGRKRIKRRGTHTALYMCEQCTNNSINHARNVPSTAHSAITRPTHSFQSHFGMSFAYHTHTGYTQWMCSLGFLSLACSLSVSWTV